MIGFDIISWRHCFRRTGAFSPGKANTLHCTEKQPILLSIHCNLMANKKQEEFFILDIFWALYKDGFLLNRQASLGSEALRSLNKPCPVRAYLHRGQTDCPRE